MRRFGKQPFAWNDRRIDDGNSTSTNDIDDGNDISNHNVTKDGTDVIAVETCRNSVQGRTIIADDQGKIFGKMKLQFS